MTGKFRKIRQLFANRATEPRKIMVQCRTVVNKDAVRRETVGGKEQIVVSSATLPDNIVMNGILYPAEEIEKSYNQLDFTHAPIEHPVDSDGNFISASDPRAIADFYAGVMNTNVRRENGRVYVDKVINVSEAMKSDRGKRLLDRINEIETNPNPRPIHTSVGLFLALEELDEPQVNAAGQKYFGIAREMVFDHDAILLDSVGAAQPGDGVGIAVNKAGHEHKVQQVNLDTDESVSDRRQAVRDALEEGPYDFDWIEELYEDHVIFWSDEFLFDVPYRIDAQGNATIVGVPLPVERTVTFTPKTNSEGDAMKELILNALKEAGIKTEGLSDDQLFEAYNQHKATESANNSESNTDGDDVATIVANAVKEATKPLVDRLDSFEANQASSQEAEIAKYAEIVGNSDKYAGLDVDAAKKLDLDTLKGMAANCQPAFGLDLTANTHTGADDKYSAPTEMVA